MAEPQHAREHARAQRSNARPAGAAQTAEADDGAAAEAQSDEAHDAGQTPTERAFQELQTARRQGSGAVVALIRRLVATSGSAEVARLVSQRLSPEEQQAVQAAIAANPQGFQQAPAADPAAAPPADPTAPNAPRSNANGTPPADRADGGAPPAGELAHPTRPGTGGPDASTQDPATTRPGAGPTPGPDPAQAVTPPAEAAQGGTAAPPAANTDTAQPQSANAQTPAPPTPVPAGTTPQPQAADPARAEAPQVPAAQGRALIEAELSHHESWGEMRNAGAGGRALRLARGLVTNDLADGVRGAAVQTAAGQAMRYATRLPGLNRLPGVGNVLGGAMSAYWLFGGGAADSVRALREGFNWAGKGPWEIAADVVTSIKSFLDIVGNVANIVSGVCYLLAGAAAALTLAAVLFPPLAALASAVPVLLNVGRLAGAVGTIAMTTSNLISPVPAVLRAIHIVTSDQDPIRLMAQEEKFHADAAGAMANYGNAMADRGIARHQARNQPASQRPRGMNPLRQFTEGIGDGVKSARSAGSDLRAGSRGQADALTNYQSERQRLSGELQARETKAQATGQRLENAQTAASADNAPRSTRAELRHATAANNKAQNRVEQTQGRIENNRAQFMDPHTGGGEVGNTTEGSYQTARNARQNAVTDRDNNTAQQVVAGQGGGGGGGAGGPPAGAPAQGTPAPGAPAPGPGAAAPERAEGPPRDARGHVVLPEPPGTLGEVDGLDQQITAQEQALQAQASHTTAATEVAGQAQQQASNLTAVEGAVAGRTQEHAATQAEHARVSAQNTDVASRTQGQNSSGDGQLERVRAVLTPLAGPARTANACIQRAPSNRFIDVDSAKNNFGQLVTGIDQITGTGPARQQAQQAQDQVLRDRESQTQTAATSRGAAQREVSTLQSRVETDRSAAEGVQTEAQADAQGSRRQEQTLQQRIAGLRQQRQQKWGALLGWAAQHRQMRRQVTGD